MTVTLRPAELRDAAAILAVQAASWRHAYEDLLPERIFPRAGDPGGIGYWQELLLAGDTATRLAVGADGAVLGFASGGGRRDHELPADGELYAIYLMPQLQGQGVGRRLFHALGAVLEARGARSMGLWALAANIPARGFYRHLGGRLARRRQSRERGVLFDEVAYVWEPMERVRG